MVERASGDLEQLGRLLADVTGLTDTIAKQSSDKKLNKAQQNTALSTNLGNINTKIGEAVLVLEKLKKLHNATITDIQSVVRSALHSGVTQGTRPISYRDATLNKRTVPKNKLIIKSEKIDDVEKELKKKVCLTKSKVNVTFFKKINSNTCIINTASREDQIKLATEIKSKIDTCQVIEEKLLNPTILVFRTKNIKDEDINEYFQDTTGEKPISTNKISTDKASRTYVQLSPHQYKTVTANGSNRIRINWESLPFVDSINPRCSVCNRFGHPAKYCKSHDYYKDFVKTCNESCSNCVADKIHKGPVKFKDLSDYFKNNTLVSQLCSEIDHPATSKNCPCYIKACEDLKGKIDFGFP